VINELQLSKDESHNILLLLWGIVGLMLWMVLIEQTAFAYQEDVVAQGGTITGVVKFSGVVPPPKTYKVTMGSNPEFCRTIANEKGMITMPQVRVSTKQQVADVVVFLQEMEHGKPAPKEDPVLTVDHCQFRPTMIGVEAGQILRVVMRDPIVHQLRGWEILDKGRLPFFHLPNLEKGGESAIPLKARRSSIIKLECDQHRFMEGWLLLTANPYVSVTNDHGAFRLNEVPQGTHTVGAWHPVLGYQESTVTLVPGRQEILELTFVSTSQP